MGGKTLTLENLLELKALATAKEKPVIAGEMFRFAAENGDDTFRENGVFGFPKSEAAYNIGQDRVSTFRDLGLKAIHEGNFAAVNEDMGKLLYGWTETPEGYKTAARQLAGDIHAIGTLLHELGSIRGNAPLAFGEGAEKTGAERYAVLKKEAERLMWGARVSGNHSSAVTALEGMGGTAAVAYDEKNRRLRVDVGIPPNAKDADGNWKKPILKDMLMFMDTAAKQNGQDLSQQADLMTFRHGQGEFGFANIVAEAGMDAYFKRDIGAGERDRVLSNVLGFPGIHNNPAYSEAFQSDIQEAFDVSHQVRIPVFRFDGEELAETAADGRGLFYRMNAAAYSRVLERKGKAADDPNVERPDELALINDEQIFPVVIGGEVKEFDGVKDLWAEGIVFDGKQQEDIRTKVDEHLANGGVLSPIAGKNGWHVLLLPVTEGEGDEDWTIYGEKGKPIILDVRGAARGAEREGFLPSFSGSRGIRL